MSIITENITKIYGQQKALNNVCIEIKSGEIAGFIGPNGAGKSTMMKILAGYIKATSGKVKICGLNIDTEPVEIKNHIGYLPENNPLYPDLYVKEFLSFIAGIYKLGKKSKNRIEEIIYLIGLEPEYDKKIGALSKGFRQRVGLAQALIHNPDVLILDEPTSGLDPNQIMEIRNLIRTIGKEKTVMLSTHIMQEVEAVCDRAIIINNGEIVADDTIGKIQHQKTDDSLIIFIEFDKPVTGQFFASVGDIIEIKEIKTASYLIKTSDKRDVRPILVKKAVDNNINVLSLTIQGKSLEEAFQELTKK